MTTSLETAVAVARTDGSTVVWSTNEVHSASNRIELVVTDNVGLTDQFAAYVDEAAEWAQATLPAAVDSLPEE